MSSEDDLTDNRIADLLERGLERFGFGDIEGALSDWQLVMVLDPDNKDAKEYLDHANLQNPAKEPRSKRASQSGQQSLDESSYEAIALNSQEHDRAMGEDVLDLGPPVIVDQDPITKDPVSQAEPDLDLYSTHLGLGDLIQPFADEDQSKTEKQNEEGARSRAGTGDETGIYKGVDDDVEDGLPESDKNFINAHQPCGQAEYIRLKGWLSGRVATQYPGDDEISRLQRVDCLVDLATKAAQRGDYRAAVIASDVADEELLATDAAISRWKVHEVAIRDFQLNFLGDTSRIGKATLPFNQVATHLDHRSAFLLSMIDGVISVDDLFDIAAMPRFEAIATVSRLILRGLIKLD